MSLNSWKREFYPVPADECEEPNALEHSLRKWRGLTPENLARHGVNRVLSSLDDGDEMLGITTQSCALCKSYLAAEPACKECPLRKVRCGYPCDAPCDQDGDEHRRIAPYGRFVQCGDPGPMIKLLELVTDQQADE